MFNKLNASSLDLAIDRAVRHLETCEFGSPEYMKTLDVALKLQKLKQEKTAPTVSRDTLATIGANLLGILMILKHEQLNVITSKALSFVPRLRI